MDFERLEQVWRSEANRPSDKLQARLTEELMTSLKTRERTEGLLALIPLATMSLFTVVAVVAVLRAGDAFRGWPGMGVLGFCWIVMILVGWFGFRARPREVDRPLRDVVARRLDQNRLERRHFHTFWLMTPVFFLPMGMVLQRLHDEGRINTAAGWLALAVCAVAVAASLGWNTARYYWVMKPEQRRLEELLREYEG
ncbi:hypothetical protein [Caulobacter sp.]|uniref:hypothetical protein n=1 Tax=Caulobacter sp. TaxID=78 RepID=UPI002B476F5A|nr:hypothetical protein [Caulobacter sp.]HJV43813.1 hypothetical protein [Caulobacter sp.]